LVNGGDAEGARVLRTVYLDPAAFEQDLPLVRSVAAGHSLYERGLAGAVVADEAHDLTGVDLKVHTGERLYGTEALVYAPQGEQRSFGRLYAIRHLYPVSPAFLQASLYSGVQISLTL